MYFIDDCYTICVCQMPLKYTIFISIMQTAHNKKTPLPMIRFIRAPTDQQLKTGHELISYFMLLNLSYV